MNKQEKHKNHEILNLIGYGLAKFDVSFIECLGFKKKIDFYKYVVEKGIAETIGTVKNRQDLFDPFFSNGRKGWWQKGDTYIHRKIFIDSLFGSLSSSAYANIVQLYLQDNFLISETLTTDVSPVLKSKFRQLQATGKKAESFFMNSYKTVDYFENGILEDAREFGDGYDFQIAVKNHFYLTEVKGVRTEYGSIRMTKNEFYKAQEYHDNYALIVVSNLDDIPKMSVFFNPILHLNFTQKTVYSTQLNYHSDSILWTTFH